MLIVLVLGTCERSSAQTIPFTSGPIPLCDTSTFTANVTGIGQLIPPSWGWGGYYLDALTINITTDHPQTLQIFLTSPEGTTLLLSEFNGAGGQNYTNTEFAVWAWNDITNGTAPFTGTWIPQGGPFNAFDNEWADGIWTITVIDTACVNTGPGPGGWTPGWFNGGGGSGGFTFTFYAPPPPCGGWIGDEYGSICQGGSIDISASFAVNYSWLPLTYTDEMGLPVPDPTVVTTPGYYYVEGYDPWDGCWYYGSFWVDLSDPVDLGPDQFVEQCSGAGPVNLVQGFNFSALNTAWTLDGAAIPASQAATASTPGVYQVIASNSGCADTALVTLSFLSSPAIGPDQNASICSSETIDLTALYSTAGMTAEWSLAGAPVITPQAVSDAGVYMLVVTSGAGCTDTAQVTITVDQAPALGADQTLDVCDNATVDLTALYNTGTASTAWTIMGAPVPVPTAIIAMGTYQLVATNATGCTDTAVVAVNVLTAPALGADVVLAACEGEVVDLSASFDPMGLAQAWTLAGTPVPDPTAVGVGGLYTLVATNAAGCSDTALVDLTMSAIPVLGPDQVASVCDGSEVDLTALFMTAPNATEWTLNGAVIPDPAAITAAGTYSITATSPAGCTASANVIVSVEASPALGTDQMANICAGAYVDLTQMFNTTGLVVEWAEGGSVVNDPTAVMVTGDYRLVVTNAAGCTDTAYVIVTVEPLPSLGADLYFSLCPWQSVDLTAVLPVSGLTAMYALDGTPVSDPTSVSQPGVYTVDVVDMNGCTDQALVTVIGVECLCVVDIAYEARCIQDPARFTLLADSIVLSAHWDFGGAAGMSNSIDPEVRFDRDGEVVVTLEATLGCGVVSAQRTIRVEDCSDSCTVWVPNAFTPNNDGINDTWSWSGECIPTDFSVQVFDRWGGTLFATTDPAKAWDGTVGGEVVPSGMYAYRVRYRLPYQDATKSSGTVTLMR